MNKSMLANLMKPLTLGLIVAVFLAIHWAIPSFYSTLWQLTLSHDIPGLTSYISSFGGIAVVLMILLIVLTNMTGLPSVQFVTVNGILFGLLPGIVISWAGQVIGNVLAFVIMRYVFRHKAQSLVNKSRWLSRLNRKIDFRLIFFFRAIPYSPNFVITALCALSRVRFGEHMAATMGGKFLAVCMEVWLGYDLIHFNPRSLILAGVMVCLLAVGLFGSRYWQKKSAK
ncbi:MAG: TVP38/TMEM64 family protein [Megasphaera sp.]|uniref:TVP38/TMEM64 family protein n=1 Tax=Megasphaera sp. TaxID=2023260 RepID=UPI003EFC5D4C